MNKLSKSEKEFIQLIQNLWKKKFFIFVICLLFTLIGFVSNYLTPKKYQSSIYLKNIPEVYLGQFAKYLYYHNNSYQVITDEFNTSFKINLKTGQNLKLFASLTNDKIFKHNIDEIKVKLSNDGLILFYYPSSVDGEKIFIDYLNFTEKNLIQIKKNQILFFMNMTKNDLLLQKNFQQKIIEEATKKNETLYLDELNKIKAELNEIDYKIDALNKITWDFKLFYIESLETKLISGNFKIIFPIAGFVFGIFLSLIIIFYRNILYIKV
jgi:ATP-dependent Lon protease